MIRRAKFVDLKQMLLLAIEAHKVSRYSNFNMDLEAAERVARQCLMAPEKPSIGSVVCFVSEEDGLIDGILLGSVSRLYETLDITVVQDFLFFVAEYAGPRVAENLRDTFCDWAFQAKGHVLVRFMVNDAIVRPDKTAIWMARGGYRHIGYGFEKEKLR